MYKPLAAAASLIAFTSAVPTSDRKVKYTPTRKFNRFIYPVQKEGKSRTAAAGDMQHYGGPVLTGTVTQYVIFYGKWSEEQKDLVRDFASGIGTSKWWDVQNTYYDPSKDNLAIGDDIPLSDKEVSDDASNKGKSIRESDLEELVSSYIKDGKLPYDNNAVYMFVASGDIDVSIYDPNEKRDYKSCREFCGFHTAFNGTDNDTLKYSFQVAPIGQCAYGCAPPPFFKGGSPNKDLAVDALLGTYAHELAEAVSDPEPMTNAAWGDDQGYENALTHRMGSSRSCKVARSADSMAPCRVP